MRIRPTSIHIYLDPKRDEGTPQPTYAYPPGGGELLRSGRLSVTQGKRVRQELPPPRNPADWTPPPNRREDWLASTTDTKLAKQGVSAQAIALFNAAANKACDEFDPASEATQAESASTATTSTAQSSEDSASLPVPQAPFKGRFSRLSFQSLRSFTSLKLPELSFGRHRNSSMMSIGSPDGINPDTGLGINRTKLREITEPKIPEVEETFEHALARVKLPDLSPFETPDLAPELTRLIAQARQNFNTVTETIQRQRVSAYDRVNVFQAHAASNPDLSLETVTADSGGIYRNLMESQKKDDEGNPVFNTDGTPKMAGVLADYPRRMRLIVLDGLADFCIASRGNPAEALTGRAFELGCTLCPDLTPADVQAHIARRKKES